MYNYKDRICNICKKTYKPKSSKQKTCGSDVCRKEQRRKSDRLRYKDTKYEFFTICLRCLKEFKVSDTRKRYCSEECRKCNRKGKEKKSIEHIRRYFEYFGYTLLSDSYVSAHKYLEYICPEGHKGKITWARFSSGARCFKCYGSKKLTLDFLRKEFEKEGYTLLSKEYRNNRQKLKYKCPNGHEHTIVWGDFKRGYRCPYCYGNYRKDISEVRSVFEVEGYKLLTKKYYNNRQKLQYICPNGHQGEMDFDCFCRGHRCSECSGKKKLDIEYVRQYLNSFGYTLLSKEYKSAKSSLKCLCPEGHICYPSFDNFKSKGNRCSSCCSNRSKAEIELYNFVCSLIGEENVIGNDRSVIPPKELDIYIPSKNLAIEYCGLYWHSEISGGKDRRYHYDKMKECNDKGVRLVTIFEDEYLERKEVVESRIKNALGIGIERIYARKCFVEEISSSRANKFLDKYHLQGKSGSSVRFGLFYKSKLVQVLTGGALSRKHTSNIKGYKGAKVLELKRFASVPGVLVVGGASKLFSRLKKFCLDNGFTHIKSYCDMRYANSFGPVYERLGFKLLTRTKWTPHYTLDYIRYRNQGLRKTTEERKTGKTEWELRLAQGYDRIWDCGHRTYIYEINR